MAEPMHAADQGVTRARGQAEVPGHEVPRDRADETGEDDVQRDRVGIRRCPDAIVAATLSETNAPTTLRIGCAEHGRAGESARVETLVAIEFAVSWNPFVKSKKSATDDDRDKCEVHPARRS